MRVTGAAHPFPVRTDRASGYSMMLRGNFKEARRSFLAAYELEATNPLVLSNLELLNSSYRYVQRRPGQP